MRHHIETARHHLIARQRECEHRVQNRETREHRIPKHAANLALHRMIRDDRAAVHLAARARHGQHTTHRNDGIIHRLHAHIVFLPRVRIAIRRHGNTLGIIAHRATAHRKDEVHLVLARQPGALAQLFHRRVRHHPRILHHRLPRRPQNLHHPVVQPALLDGRLAIRKHHHRPETRQLPGQHPQSLLTKMQPCRIRICKCTFHDADNYIPMPLPLQANLENAGVGFTPSINISLVSATWLCVGLPKSGGLPETSPRPPGGGFRFQ